MKMSQTSICRGRATSVKHGADGSLEVVYHNTAVVTRRADGTIILRTGGYKSATTRTRQNQASNQFNLGYGVFQKDYDWFVTYKGATLAFNGDEITLPA
jgi:hypothetical protein